MRWYIHRWFGRVDAPTLEEIPYGMWAAKSSDGFWKIYTTTTKKNPFELIEKPKEEQ